MTGRGMQSKERENHIGQEVKATSNMRGEQNRMSLKSKTKSSDDESVKKERNSTRSEAVVFL